ncbi:MAG: transporter permease [Noviherbaspirillum sp.]|nr:transporter permease [Noviherbaspirillum sp.]
MRHDAPSRLQLRRWLIGGEWRAHPLRVSLAVAAIALGVALGFAIHLINAAAFNEFTAAVKSISGQADLQLRAVQPLFDEALFARLAQREEIALASPVLEIDAAVAGEEKALKVLGVDPLRSGGIAPDLLGTPAEGRALDIFGDDTIFLSPAAMEWLKLKEGDALHLRIGIDALTLRVAGGIAGARPGQRIAVMDIGAAQWRFGQIGRLTRIDLKLTPGVSRDTFKRRLSAEFGAQFRVTETGEQEAQASNMSRAYRVNLNMLAMVALFTGAFLVFSTQALSVIRRRGQLALLRVMGMRRGQVLAQILTEGLVLGAAGSLIGLAVGYALAAAVLRLFGGDLGGGYFPGVAPSVQFSFTAAATFFLLGTGISLIGCASPAWEAANAKPAQSLKSGSEDMALSKLASPWPALACLLAAAALTRMPAANGLPVFGYLAIALFLVGGIGLMPRIALLVFAALSRRMAGSARSPVATLALARLANAPNQASIALGGVLTSFSLMVAMAIMVSSFRVSVDDWLLRLLSADIYVRPAAGGNTAALKEPEQQSIASAPGIARAEFSRFVPLTLDPARPPVTLIARPIDAADPGKRLVLTGDPVPPAELPKGALPVWVSEAMLDLYGYRPGRRVALPIGAGMHEFVVAGVWRDYARQSGAIQMRLSDYRMLTADLNVNDIALWLRPGVSAEEALAGLRRLPFADTLEFAQPDEIRALSLRIFDRSFAVTYLLEIVAIVIGLFGVAATFSAQTLARAKEFGMLRHVGVTRRQILGMLGAEGSLLTALGIGVGFLLGTVISLVLVFIVNPQSFHWTMQLHIPWGMLATVASLMLASAAVTALLAGRHAVSGEAVRAVREDW